VIPFTRKDICEHSKFE